MEQYIFIDHIQPKSLVDGPGERTVLFTRGCPIHCPGCQSPHLWEPVSQNMMPVNELANTLGLLARTKSLTITGGEPMAQPKALAFLLKALAPHKLHVILYTGYTWNQITSPVNPATLWIREILKQIDVLVDGPFKQNLDNDFISYRGSSNQRPIDIKETYRTGVLTVLNWDSEVIIDPAGLVTMPVGFVDDLSSIGKVQQSRMCGEA